MDALLLLVPITLLAVTHLQALVAQPPLKEVLVAVVTVPLRLRDWVLLVKATTVGRQPLLTMQAAVVVREQLVLLVPRLSVERVGLEQYRTLLDRLLPTQEVGALMVLGLLDLVAQEVAGQDLLQEREPMEQPTRVAVLVEDFLVDTNQVVQV